MRTMQCRGGLQRHAAFKGASAGHDSCIRRPMRCLALTASQQQHSTDMAAELSASSVYEAKAIGTMLGAMSGNVLGAPFEHDRHFRITRMHPYGILDFWHFDLAQQPVPYGHYTGDFGTMLAVAQALITSGKANVFDIAATLAASYQPPFRRYNPYAELLLQSLRTFPDLHSLPQMAHEYQVHTTQRPAQSSSNRAEREPWGWSDNGAAVRVAPIGLAYRNADMAVLKQAVHASSLFSHTHELGRDGALVQAAAVAFLSRLESAEDPNNHPAVLLEHLLGVAETEDMRSKLKLMLRGLVQLGEISDYSSFWASQQWHEMVRMANWLTYQNYATVGTEAAALALWCLVTSWQQPRQAVGMAVSFGGSAPVTACMTGALAGALHGTQWIPSSWYADLENSLGGRDVVVDVARRLAELDCADVAPVNPSSEEAEVMLEQYGQQWDQAEPRLQQQVQELGKEIDEAARKVQEAAQS